MSKIDFKKENKELYSPSAKGITLIEVPEMNFLMIDGKGDPNTSQDYQTAIEALFSVSYKVKFMSEKKNSQDYVVLPLEGLWWTENMENFSIEDKSDWNWTAMIRQPEFITPDLIKEAVAEIEKKKNLPALSRIRFESLKEGLSAQIMHIGSYSQEKPTIEKLHNFIKEHGYGFDGNRPVERHHEIYLSDSRRTTPEKLKTIIRQPIKKIN
ncbi:MAG: GyrI-like domain-containing protein [Methanosarcina sp.]